MQQPAHHAGSVGAHGARRPAPRLALDIRRRRGAGRGAGRHRFVTVRGLTRDTDAAALRGLFGAFGPLADIQIMGDPASAPPSAMALLTYRSAAHAETAARFLDGFPVNGAFVSATHGRKWAS